MVEIIADITQNSKLDASAVNREKDVILREMEEVNKDIVELIFDQLHAVAFSSEFATIERDLLMRIKINRSGIQYWDRRIIFGI